MVIVIMYLAKNFLFFGVCLYMVALYEELMQQLRRIDDDDGDGDRRLHRILHCIRMHKRIIGYYAAEI